MKLLNVITTSIKLSLRWNFYIASVFTFLWLYFNIIDRLQKENDECKKIQELSVERGKKLKEQQEELEKYA